MSRERIITSQLEAEGIDLSERLGQHFLVDERAISELATTVIVGSKVIEVGSGIGHVTEALAQRAGSVVGIEIDKRFQPVLEDIQERNPKVRFIFGDALRVQFDSLIGREEEAQIVANLPFHITEPFMYKLIDLPITNAVLMLGDNVAREFQESETSMGFGKLSLLGQTFFDSRVLAQVPREAFFPQPRTDAVIMEFDPKDKREIQANLSDYVFAYLFRRAGKYGLVVNDMKQALIEVSQRGGSSDLSKRESHRRDRSNAKRELRQLLGEYNGSRDISVFNNSRGGAVVSQSQALDVIGRMGVPESILGKPFFRLDNQDVRELAIAVRGFYSR
jgi:16S rRNA (adenine1518-N6/adenine1519-N6)-dimethyltransferase